MDSYFRTLSPSSTVNSSDADNSDAEHAFSGRWDLLGNWRSIGGEPNDYDHDLRTTWQEELDTDDSEDDASFVFSDNDDNDTPTRQPQEQRPYWQRSRRRNAVLLLTESSSEDISDVSTDEDDKEEGSGPEDETMRLRSTEWAEEEDDDDNEDEEEDDESDENEEESSYSPSHMAASISSTQEGGVVVWDNDSSTHSLRRQQNDSPSSSPTSTPEYTMYEDSTNTLNTESNDISNSSPVHDATTSADPISLSWSQDIVGHTSPRMQDDDDTTLVPSSTPGQYESGEPLLDTINTEVSITSTGATTNSDITVAANELEERSSPQGFSGVFLRNRTRIASPRFMEALRRRQRFQPWSSNGSSSLTELLPPITLVPSTPSPSTSAQAHSPSAATSATSDSDLPSSETSSVVSCSAPATPQALSTQRPTTGDGSDQPSGTDGTLGSMRRIAASTASQSSTRGSAEEYFNGQSRSRMHGRLSLQAIREPHRHTWWHRNVPSTGLTMAIPMSPRCKALKKHQRPCIFLQAGQQFRGTQNLMSQYTQSGRTHTTASGRAGHMEEWHVKVTINAVDYASGTVFGLMEAMDVPTSSSNVITYWEGEIVDFQNNDLWTKKWATHSRTDIDHWKRLEAFKGLDERAIVRGAKTGKFRGHLRQHFIFMRWKEKHFVNATEHTNGLTIAGFYYIALRRADGFIEGYYYDRQSTPFQRLCLHPHSDMLGQSSSNFEFA
ncbi:hypothetical protein BGW42_005207 [Actinomortierella wolfii]|nr:hypothetical protein BGW42_005207 [Actinomortierella wolfii]